MTSIDKDISRTQGHHGALAMFGGTPVRTSMLRYSSQSLDADDRKAVEAVLKSDFLTTGPAVRDFENALCAFTKSKHAVAVSNGTSALHVATAAIGLRPGDEVIVPAISFVASANCVLYQGARPVFADVEPDTLNICPKDVVAKITPKTKAIIAVDMAGHACDHDVLRSIADRQGIPVIEDAAHAISATYKGRQVGVLQKITTFSFHPVKPITTGEGGAVLCDDAELVKTMRSFRHHGVDLDYQARERANSYEYDVAQLGYNYRIPDINCALGISQLKKLGDWKERRQHIANIYNEELASMPGLELPVVRPECESAWHLYIVRLNLAELTATRSVIFKALVAENLGVNVHYIPIPWLTLYARLGYERGNWPVAETEYERLLSLPLFPTMTEQDIADVIAGVRKVLSHFRK